MDIGGKDVVLPAPDSAELRQLIETFLHVEWPDLVREDDPSGELFYFENAEAKASWDRDGLTDDNHDKMVHVIYGEDGTTLVVSHEPGAETAKWAAELLAHVSKRLTPGV